MFTLPSIFVLRSAECLRCMRIFILKLFPRSARHLELTSMVRVFLKYKGSIYLKFEVYTRYNNMLFVIIKCSVYLRCIAGNLRVDKRQKFIFREANSVCGDSSTQPYKQNLVLFLIKDSFHKRR